MDISALVELKSEMTEIGFETEVFQNELHNLPEKIFSLSKDQECSIFALLIHTSVESDKPFFSSNHSADLIEEDILRKISESPSLKGLER